MLFFSFLFLFCAACHALQMKGKRASAMKENTRIFPQFIGIYQRASSHNAIMASLTLSHGAGAINVETKNNCSRGNIIMNFHLP